MTDSANAPVEKVSQPDMLRQFQERLKALTAENNQLISKVRENEQTAFKLQGAIETLVYYNPDAVPPEEGTNAPDIPADDVTDGSPELATE
tara:strand:+ start:5983 stop:6255 length:273 start_codon:yes stop_codon:yes gene_type:complete